MQYELAAMARMAMPNPRIIRPTMNCAMCLAVVQMTAPMMITTAPAAMAMRRPNLSVIHAAKGPPIREPTLYSAKTAPINGPVVPTLPKVVCQWDIALTAVIKEPS